MSALDWCLVIAGVIVVAWWTFASSRPRAALDVCSVGLLVLAVVTLAVEGYRWQLVPWQVLGLVAVALVVLRGRDSRRKDARYRDPRDRGLLSSGGVIPDSDPDSGSGSDSGSSSDSGPSQDRHSSPHSRGRRRRGGWWRPTAERGVPLVVALLGVWALLWAFVPTLPTPSGPYRVGTEVFHWVDKSRHQPWGPKTSEYRQVVAQAWYPTEVKNGKMAPYFEDPDELPGMGGLPAYVFSGSFRDTKTHGIVGAPVSGARREWPVLVFSPGLELPREIYTALCTQVASRGYVVLALSSAYESAVTELANGEVVESSFPKDASEKQLFELVKTRAADASFAVDQLERLSAIDPRSPLVGRLDMAEVGIFGHSMGGASAIQAAYENKKFRVAINLDGTLWGSQPSERLDRPFLWIASAERSSEEEDHDREQFLSGLQSGGALVKITHSMHLSFTDEPSYLTSLGLAIWGRQGRMGRRSATTMSTLTADLIAAFAGPELGVHGGPTLSQVVDEHGAAELKRRVAAMG
jgi:dienelactone hydrolase